MKRLAVSVAVLACAGLACTPSYAAPKKKQVKATYTVTLAPDPTANVFTTAGVANQCGANPQAKNHHAFTVPAAGILAIVLDAKDPAPGTPYVFDWDLYLNDATGNALNEGTSSEAHEEITTKFKKGATVDIVTCNLNGQPQATVSYVFTYA